MVFSTKNAKMDITFCLFQRLNSNFASKYINNIKERSIMKMKTMAIALVAGTLLMGSCASKKDLENCKSENAKLSTNYQESKEALAAANARIQLSARPTFTVSGCQQDFAGQPRKEP